MFASELTPSSITPSPQISKERKHFEENLGAPFSAGAWHYIAVKNLPGQQEKGCHDMVLNQDKPR
jgi:hypothetical protein